MQYNKMRLSVGVFMITLLLTLIVSTLFLLKEKGIFDERHTYHFTTNSAEYFNIGTPLRFSGFNIGLIEDITLKDDGSVYMSFSVSEKNRKWISQGSVLMIIKPLLGSPHIEVYTSLGTPPLEDGAVLTMLLSDNINDLIVKLQPAVKKAVNILNSIEKITTYLASENSELKQILKNLNKFSAKLANDDSLLTTATGDKKATRNIVDSIDEMSQIMKDIKLITGDVTKISSTLKSDIVTPASSSIKEIDLIMKDVKNKLETLNPTVDAVGSYDKELLELKEQISVGVQKSTQIMDKIDALMQDKESSEVTLP